MRSYQIRCEHDIFLNSTFSGVFTAKDKYSCNCLKAMSKRKVIKQKIITMLLGTKKYITLKVKIFVVFELNK